jgi:hypothetical protein
LPHGQRTGTNVAHVTNVITPSPNQIAYQGIPWICGPA